MLTPADRELALSRMEEACSRFYRDAISTGNHPFIEFTGVMQAYIKSCRRAHEASTSPTAIATPASSFPSSRLSWPTWPRSSTASLTGASKSDQSRRLRLFPSPAAFPVKVTRPPCPTTTNPHFSQ